MALSVCLKIFELSPDLNIFNTTSYFKEVVFLFCANVFCGAVYIFFHKKHEIFFSLPDAMFCVFRVLYTKPVLPNVANNLREPYNWQGVINTKLIKCIL